MKLCVIMSVILCVAVTMTMGTPVPVSVSVKSTITSTLTSTLTSTPTTTTTTTGTTGTTTSIDSTDSTLTTTITTTSTSTTTSTTSTTTTTPLIMCKVDCICHLGHGCPPSRYLKMSLEDTKTFSCGREYTKTIHNCETSKSDKEYTYNTNMNWIYPVVIFTVVPCICFFCKIRSIQRSEQSEVTYGSVDLSLYKI